MAQRPPWETQIEAPEVPDGWRTGPPDFVGVGAQRCGTSWWYSTLRAHPAVRAPGKELHFFDWFADGNLPSDFAERYHAMFPRPEGAISGEWTPRYMADTWTIRMLREAAPEAKVLIMLRDPVERYHSAASHERWKAGGQMRERLATLSDALWRGYYHEQVRHVLDLFGREQVQVLQFERCQDDPPARMRETCEFLGIDPDLAPLDRLGEHRGKRHRKDEIPAWLRADLADRYAEDARRLAELCPEIDLERWPSIASPPAPGPVVSANVGGAPEPPAASAGAAQGDPAVLEPQGMRRWLRENKGLWRRVPKQYRDWALRYRRTHHKHFRDTLSLVRDAAGQTEIRRVVDVGSVPGYVSALLAAAGYEVHAVDLDPDRIAKVLDELGIAAHRADIEVQDFPLESGSVDLALLCQTLEHLRNDPLRPVKEIGRVLRPGGYAIVSVPNVTPYMKLKFVMGDDEIFGDPIGDRMKLRKVGHAGDNRLYSKRQVERMLDRGGMDMVKDVYGGGIRIRKDDQSRAMQALARVSPGRMQGTRYFLARKREDSGAA